MTTRHLLTPSPPSKDLHSTEELYTHSLCTNPERRHCSRVDQYHTQLINLTLTDGTPKRFARIVITIELGEVDQPSGVVSLVETAVVEDACSDNTLQWVDPCMDMGWPCDDNICIMKGWCGMCNVYYVQCTLYILHCVMFV